MRTVEQYKELLPLPEVQGMLRLIRQGESGQSPEAYHVRWGGTGKKAKYFESLEEHPRILEPGPRGPSSAAGAYQITMSTYDDFAPRLGIVDFSAESQDILALAIMDSEGALDLVLEGKIEDAIKKLGGRWASLPSNTDGQPTKKLAELLEVYQKYSKAAPVVLSEKKESFMAAPLALIAGIISSILPSVPSLVQLFGPGGERTEKNAKAAQIVVDTALKVTGAVNEQQALERLADSATKEAVAAAVKADPYIMALTEVGGGIQKAREIAATPGALPFWKQGAFIMGIVLTPLIYMVVYRILWGVFSEQLQTVVVTAVLSGLLGALTGFFFGSMFSSGKRTTDIMGDR